ncbi:MAG: hypothetical protein ACJ71D_06810 [Nitrososphaera sp.]
MLFRFNTVDAKLMTFSEPGFITDNMLKIWTIHHQKIIAIDLV